MPSNCSFTRGLASTGSGSDPPGVSFALTRNVKAIPDKPVAVSGWDVDRVTLDAAPVGITICDATQQARPFVYANDRFLSMTGYEREAVLGEPYQLLAGPATENLASVEQAMAAGESTTTELRTYRADGAPFRSRVTLVGLADGDHCLLYYETVSDTTGPVALADVTEACWERLGASGVELVVRTDKHVRADRELLGELLEQLFRNAIDHGDAWQITLGELGDGSGFYVEDDGCGIAEERRETLVGTADGDGLAFCEQVADAHGWELSITAPRTGGTRVELSGVEFRR